MSLAAEVTSQVPALVPWPSTTRLWPGPGGQPQSCLLSRDSWCVVAGSWAAQLELASRSRRRQSYLPPTGATAPCAPSSSHPLLSGDCPSSVPAAQRHGRARGRRAAARAHPCTPQNTAGDSADEPGIRNCKQRMQRRCGGGACVGRATLAHTTSELRQELVEDAAEHGRLRWRRLRRRRRRRRLRRWRWRRRGGQRATWRLGVPPVPQQRACAVSCIHPACMAPASGRAPLATLCGWPVLERGQLTLAPAVLCQQDVVQPLRHTQAGGRGRRRRRLRRWRWRRRGGQRATRRLGVPPVPQQRACVRVSPSHAAPTARMTPAKRTCSAGVSGQAVWLFTTCCGWLTHWP